MRLFIAEKPSLAGAIAHGLGKFEKQNGYYKCGNNDIVTWCFGHIMTQFSPAEYDEKYKSWKLDDLPIIPDKWKLKVSDIGGASAQFKVIKKLAKEADIIVNAGDPDREGQLLVDEVLDYIGVLSRGSKIKRILLNALDEKSVREALNNLKPNDDFIGLRNSALARSRADWLIGMNMTRACTVHARKFGYEGVFSVGRVQTPTVALVVRREQEIKNFKPIDFFTLGVTWKHKNGDIRSSWKPCDDSKGLDNEGRVIDKGVADDALKKVTGSTGKIIKVEKKKGQSQQRLPYSLSSLQIEAGRKFGYSPKDVLDAQQSLYEKKLTSYPRSDCEYLPVNQLDDAEHIVGNILQLSDDFKRFANKVDLKIKSRAWNDSKISAHHAIIPTTVKANLSDMTDTEKNCYLLVCKAYLAQFFPPQTFMSTTMIVEAEGESFHAKGKIILDMGWQEIYHGDKKQQDESEGDDESVTLPDANEGDSVAFVEGAVASKKTKPPSRFTTASLLEAMKKIGAYVKDESLKPALKNCSGIGTEATRASEIETIQKRGYVRIEKKYLVPTDSANLLLSILPDIITYPDTTALWEINLDKIVESKDSPDKFLAEQKSSLVEMISSAVSKDIPRNTDGGGGATVLGKCPLCGKDVVERKNSFSCTGYPSCGFTLWKEAKGGILKGKKISSANAKSFLSGKSVAFKNLTSSSGKKYDAVLKMTMNGKFPNFEFVNKK